MPDFIVFDVNETLLDVAALDPLFQRLFGDARTRTEWFLTLEESWLTATIVDRYQPFGELVKAALVTVGRRRGVEVGEAAQRELVEGVTTLPAHPDVAEALDLLRSRGLRLAALTNGTLAAAEKQLATAGLRERFEAVCSVDEVRRYKPAPAPYRLAARRMGGETRQMLMVAAHAWDIDGAAAAGCATAFVQRPGKALNPAGVRPDIEGAGLLEVAHTILSLRSGSA